jgi:putative transposase
LLNTAEKHSWKLQAWAVFPNHYHFVAISPGDAPSLRTLIQELHSLTAREINRLDRTPSRKVWFEYWDSRITFEKSYFARLSYVHQNAIHHGLVSLARDYPWCSAAWFERTANTGLYRTIASFTGKGVKVRDDYVVEPDEIGPA